MFRSHFMILLTLAFLSFSPAMAQDSEEFNQPLSKKQAKQIVKLTEDALKDAKRAQSRDDHPKMGRDLERYSYHMNNLERGLNNGNVPPDEHEDVAEIVPEGEVHKGETAAAVELNTKKRKDTPHPSHF